MSNVDLITKNNYVLHINTDTNLGKQYAGRLEVDCRDSSHIKETQGLLSTLPK